MTPGDAPSDPPAWLDPDQPHDEARSAAQIDGVLEHLGETPRCVLDLGCGSGRVLLPAARAGHHVTGVDRCPRALRAVEDAVANERLRDHVALHEADFLAKWPVPGPFDIVLCLGNTFMQVAEIDAAVHLLRRIREGLAPDGAVILDDLPEDFWPELTDGNWQGGVSPDGAAQLLWHPTDAVFALRTGEAVDLDDWSIRPGEACYRLWTDGGLRLAAALAGLSAPRRVAQRGLLVLYRADDVAVGGRSGRG